MIFNFGFIKFRWEEIKGDILRVVHNFEEDGRWPRGSNTSFISLIPKVDNPLHLNDFRPISFVGRLYKIMAKILTMRLKKVLHKVIDGRQFAFLEGNGLMDGVLVANKVLEEVKRRKSSCVFFKVDYEKAYDSIIWDFVYYMLERLGFCGHACLIKSVLSTLPLFYMSMFKMSAMVVKDVVKLQRNFLWGWGSGGRKIAWVSWKKVCRPREEKGLGMLDIRRFNTTLLGKWIWRLGHEEKGLWKEVLESKYRGWQSLWDQRKGGFDSLWWRDLQEVWSFEGWKNEFKDNCKWEVENGREIRLWEDKWVDNMALKDNFPTLFSIVAHKGASLAQGRVKSENSEFRGRLSREEICLNEKRVKNNK